MQGEDFTSRLKYIKREVLALKQAHEYGLGSANFYYKSVSIDTPPTSLSDVDLRLTIVYDMQGVEQPFQILQPQMALDKIYGVVWDGPNKTFTMAYSESNFIFSTHYMYAVATQPIKSMTLERI